MRVILQRVSEASVEIDGVVSGQIAGGLLIFLGIESADCSEDVEWLLSKIIHMRIFADKDGKMNNSVVDQDGELLIISQFTLHASTKKGNRPSFIKAAPPIIAVPLYEEFVKKAAQLLPQKVQTGQFGADMKVRLLNDGPVTIVIDSKDRQ